jgi:hypothetical protein
VYALQSKSTKFSRFLVQERQLEPPNIRVSGNPAGFIPAPRIRFVAHQRYVESGDPRPYRVLIVRRDDVLAVAFPNVIRDAGEGLSVNRELAVPQFRDIP